MLASAMTGCNAGFMGLPIASAVFGELVFYYLVIQNIANNLYLFVMSLAQLHHRESEKSSKSLSEKLKPLVNPTSVATIVSLIMLFAGIHLPEYAMDIVSTLGDITIPLSMILVGVQLGGADFKKTDRRQSSSDHLCNETDCSAGAGVADTRTYAGRSGSQTHRSARDVLPFSGYRSCCISSGKQKLSAHG